MIAINAKEYLRTPTKEDIKSIVALHKAKHKVDNHIGSLDCTHMYRKNCTTAWKGHFKGSQTSPCIVLEAVADYNLWFRNPNPNILNRSPLMNMMLHCCLHDLAKETGFFPFQIGDEKFS
jgi:hypothetical protein